MTLRLRLLLVLVGIVAVGLIASDVATYSSLARFLTSQVDQELSQAVIPVLHDMAAESAGVSGGFGRTGGAGSFVPPGTYGILRDQSGTVLAADPFCFDCGAVPAAPTLPVQLPGSGSSSSAGTYFSASSPSGSVHYRVLAEAIQGGGTLAVAIPLTDARDTLGRLLLIETLVSAVVLAALGVLAWWIVRRGLRPLDEMATTAGAIAAGDLSQRVGHSDTDTEVGRLGTALNTMLGSIEGAFAARAASEERLRRFLADASHELRTPLTSIRGYAEIFHRGARDRPEDLDTSMRHIRSEADRMSELVDDLLLLARLDRERPFEHENVDLAAVAHASADAAAVAAPQRTITTQTNGPVIVTGDASRLRQVIDNLVSNAVKHTPEGSPVDIRVTTDDQRAVVEVRDYGPGIPADEQASIFEPFHRSDPSRARATGGAGLGLAIASAITQAHSGEVGVVSNGSGGAVFWVRIPLAHPEPAATD